MKRMLMLVAALCLVAVSAQADPFTACKLCAQPTTTVQGQVLESQVDSNVAIVWKVSGEVIPVVCMRPFLDPDDCGVQGIFTPVCGTAHIEWYAQGPYPPGAHLIVNSLETCP